MADKNYQVTFNYNLSTLPLVEASKEIFFDLANRKLNFETKPSAVISGLGSISVSVVYDHVTTNYFPLEETSRLIKKLDTIVKDNSA